MKFIPNILKYRRIFLVFSLILFIEHSMNNQKKDPSFLPQIKVGGSPILLTNYKFDKSTIFDCTTFNLLKLLGL